jgi:hypothetical protein
MAQNWHIKGNKFVFPKGGKGAPKVVKRKYPVTSTGKDHGSAMDPEDAGEQRDEIGDSAGGEMGHDKRSGGKACPMCGK